MPHDASPSLDRVPASPPLDERAWRDLVESSPEVYYKVTTEHGLMHGRVVFVSRRAEELTGFPAAEFATHPSLWASLIHPEDLPIVMTTTMQMAESQTPVTREYRIKDRDGAYRWMEDRVSPVVDDAGRLLGYQGVAADVSVRRAAQASALAAQERLRTVLTTGRIAYWEWRLTTHDVIYSAEWARAMGLGEHELRESIDFWQQRLDQDDRTRVLGTLHQVLAGPESRASCPYRLHTQDGLVLSVLGSWSVQRNETGEATHVLGVEVDVTALVAS